MNFNDWSNNCPPGIAEKALDWRVTQEKRVQGEPLVLRFHWFLNGDEHSCHESTSPCSLFLVLRIDARIDAT